MKDFNAQQPEFFKGLVQPTETEQTLNGYKLRNPHQINWETQSEKALNTFQSKGFIILVDNEQVTEL
ncbi:MAG: hypothetical protein AAF572_08725 [Cyanobacteria bacterium P01_B01_bin.77]